MDKLKAVITDYLYEDIRQEREVMKQAGVELFDYQCKTEDDVIKVASDCDALICQFAPITRRVIESLHKCKVIVRYAIGVDIIDLKAAEEHGIYVCNVPDYGIDEVSNHAAALILDCARKLTYMTNQVKQGKCNYTLLKPLYRTAGKTLGLVGFGRIARMLAKKMSGFDLNIIAYDPMLDRDKAEELNVTPVTFEELVRMSDFISVHCPLNAETHHMFDKEVFLKMKKTAVFVNTARGALVDEKDLVWALENHVIAMAGLDVTEVEPIPAEHPLLKMDNAVVTSHVAWYTEEAIKTLQLKTAQEAARVICGGLPQNPVNHPVKY